MRVEAQAPRCAEIFGRAPVREVKPQNSIDDLFSHIYFVTQLAPAKIKSLEEIGISPQVVRGVRQLYSILENVQRISTDLADINRLILDPATTGKEIVDYQKWQAELQMTLRELGQTYNRHRTQLINFVKIHLIYPKFDGVFIEISQVEGANNAEVFTQKVKEIYESYALQEGWQMEVIAERPNHVRLLIHSQQALAHLIGETGIHSWNTVQAEYGNAVLATDPGRADKRRMARVQVEILPYFAFRYRMDMQDVNIEQYNSASGNGGQKRNKTSSDVRATHIPSGVSVKITESRSAAANRQKAIERLEEKVTDYYRELPEANVRSTFVGIHGMETSRVSRSYHLKENVITGVGGVKFTTSENSMASLSATEVFPSIRSNASMHFDLPSNQRIENALSRVLSIEREATAKADPEVVTHLQSHVDSLLSP